MPDIKFDANVDKISVTKNGVDLIVSASYNGKKTTTDSVTIKNYYGENDPEYGLLTYPNLPSFKVYSGDSTFSTIESLMEDNGVKVLGQTAQMPSFIKKLTGESKFKQFYGTQYNDTITTSKGYFNVIVDSSPEGNNTYNLGNSKHHIYAGEGNDQYNISTLQKLTQINDQGGENLYNIKVKNTNDIYVLANVSTYGYGSINGAFLTDGKGISALKNIDYNSDAAEFEIFKKAHGVFFSNLNGLVSTDDEDNLIYSTINLTTGKGTYALDTDSMLKVSDTMGGMLMVNPNNVNTPLLMSMQYHIRSFMQYTLEQMENYAAEGIDVNEISLPTSSFALLGAKASTLESELGITEKNDKKEFETFLKQVKQNLIDIYKYYRIGTDGNESYTIGQSGAIIASGYGSDTFNFSKKITDSSKAMVPTYTVINSKNDSGEKDKIVFTNYAFDKSTLDIIPQNAIYYSLDSVGLGVIRPTGAYGSLQMMAYDSNGSHMVYYRNFFGNENAIAYDEGELAENQNDFFYSADSYREITLKDKSKTYTLFQEKNDNGVDYDWSGKSDKNKNHMAYIWGNQNSIVSNNGTNYIQLNDTGFRMSDSDFSSLVSDGLVSTNYTYNGGKDIVISNSEISYDIYNVKFDKNTSLYINDNGGYDAVKISGNENNMRLFINFEYDKETQTASTEGSTYTILDKSGLTKGNLDFAVDGEFKGFKKGINISGEIESYEINNIKSVDYGTWISELKEGIESWFSSYTGNKSYESVSDVLEGGVKNDIASILKVYTNASTHYQDLSL